MARARNLKPSLFKNELLGVADPLLTILFQSLWCLADKAGRLEDRPLRIKAETFPYREGIDVNVLLTELQRLGFICRYNAGGMSLIQVLNFCKHQNPHKTERESELPEMPLESKGCSITDKYTLNNGSRPADSLLPLTDSLKPLTDSSLAPDKSGADKSPGKTSLSKSDLMARGVDEQVAIDFLELRKRKKAPLTNTAFQGLQREAEKAGVSISEALATCAARGWTGLNAEWLTKQAPAQPSRHSGFSQRDYQAGVRDDGKF